VLLPDSGRNYLGKLYDDDWLRRVGVLNADEAVTDYDWRATEGATSMRANAGPGTS
jgi:hypothetical protein